ncbi:prepilin-type N-terminal cleavage/methylation domain-containing protein [Psychrobacter sp. BI730]|uniref:type IV pilin protein n=1 Tax=Psychrobacter sp. BI730 TaxID=2705463 RepID=UPI0015C936BD|nr:prepilin-type N-terminal cleavage/methylation domain-containing protein [Psychrobacter sp. BI730]NYR08859.1 prepilin-type N-terminal cleavage/methylation domain-containing protein [Psychrobacter sp. BI730]
MQIDSNTTVTVFKKQSGFTLIELMIVIAIIGILAAIAYPSYQQYVIKTKRTDMMSEMHNIASEVQSRKLAQGAYSNALIAGLSGDYPKQGDALYTVSFTPNPITSEWSIIATPKNGSQLANDGTLSLNFQGIKCRGDNPNNKCGTGDEWR